MTKQSHPYHYSVDKNLMHRVIDIGVPLALLWLYFQFYNFGKISPSEMVKTTGLWSIALLGLTLLIGPLGKIIPSLDFLKAHRKFWGVTSFLIAFLHMALVYIFFFKYDVTRFFNTANPKYLGILAGLISLGILLVVTLTSNKKALNALSPEAWKMIQVTSYIALILALAHFYLMEQVDGALLIKRLLGQITFGFTGAVVLVRLLILLIPAKKS